MTITYTLASVPADIQAALLPLLATCGITEFKSGHGDFIIHYHTDGNKITKREHIIPAPHCKMHVHLIQETKDTAMPATSWFPTVQKLISGKTAVICEWPVVDETVFKTALFLLVKKCQESYVLERKIAASSALTMKNNIHSPAGLTEKIIGPCKVKESVKVRPLLVCTNSVKWASLNEWSKVCGELRGDAGPTPVVLLPTKPDETQIRSNTTADDTVNLRLLLCEAGEHALGSTIISLNFQLGESFVFIVHFNPSDMKDHYQHWLNAVGTRFIPVFNSHINSTGAALYRHVCDAICQAVAQHQWTPIDFALYNSKMATTGTANGFAELGASVNLLKINNAGFLDAMQ